MKSRAKIFIQFIFGVIGSFIFGFLGMMLGMTSWAMDFKYPLEDTLGYGIWDAGIHYFALAGIAIGSFLGILITNKIMGKKTNITLGLIVIPISYIIIYFCYLYSMLLFTIAMIPIVPAILTTIAVNREKTPKK